MWEEGRVLLRVGKMGRGGLWEEGVGDGDIVRWVWVKVKMKVRMSWDLDVEAEAGDGGR